MIAALRIRRRFTQLLRPTERVVATLDEAIEHLERARYAASTLAGRARQMALTLEIVRELQADPTWHDDAELDQHCYSDENTHSHLVMLGKSSVSDNMYCVIDCWPRARFDHSHVELGETGALAACLKDAEHHLMDELSKLRQQARSVKRDALTSLNT